jgi:hypothetical protein
MPSAYAKKLRRDKSGFGKASWIRINFLILKKEGIRKFSGMT